MGKKLFDVHVPVHWEVVNADQPGVIMLRLRYKTLADVLAGGTEGGTTVLLALNQKMVRDLVRDLTGRTEAEPPRPDS
jgi:hypothetical protein